MVFEDDFEDSELNRDIWRTYPSYGRRCANANVPQKFMDENISLDNGILTLTFKKEPVAVTCPLDSVTIVTKEYTSGYIESLPRVLFGRIEAKIKIANGDGLYPAFWLCSGDGEIDIFEFMDSERHPKFTPHNTATKGYRYWCVKTQEWLFDLSQDYHIYALEWDPYYLKFYIDNVLAHKVMRYTTLIGNSVYCDDFEAGKIYREAEYFPPGDSPEAIIISFGGQNNGPYTALAELKVDWVRAWELVDIPCRDIYISNLGSNHIQGKSITVGGSDINITTGKVITLTAQEYIILKSGVDMNFDLGATFTLEIDPNLCSP